MQPLLPATSAQMIPMFDIPLDDLDHTLTQFIEK